MRIAYFSPLPPQRTGVADYSKELLPALASRAKVDLWVDEPTTIEPPPHSRIVNYAGRPESRDALRGYDSVVYHMGNSPIHRNIFRTLLAVPGVVVLHDFVLHHFFAAYYLEALHSPASYIEEMAYNYGAAGEEQARIALQSERQIWEHEPIRYPLNKRVLDHALGVIVHSEFARRLVHQSHPHLPVAKVNLPVAIAESLPDVYELRERYRIPAGRVVIASLGFGSVAKRIEMVLQAVAALERKDFLYLLVGEVGESFQRDLRRRGLGEIVRATGYVDWKTFNDYCQLIDVGIDLRYPTMGESSASVCRVLGSGKPCVVSDLGWFAELPDDCVVKIDVAAGEERLVQSLSDLIDDRSLRCKMGENAHRYIGEQHGIEQAATEYINFLGAVRARERRRSVEHSLINDTGRAMAEIGVGEDEGWLIGGVAADIESLFKTVRNERS
jgi:glycosyltransferase involved in cell wall biosynthesis